jgi:hypothetical protein
MIPPARYVPRCEQLEDRLVPALTIRQVGTTLRIIGEDNLNDFIQINDAGTGTPGSIVVVANGQFRFSNLPVTRIVVRTGAGNDTVTYQMQRPGSRHELPQHPGRCRRRPRHRHDEPGRDVLLQQRHAHRRAHGEG